MLQGLKIGGAATRFDTVLQPCRSHSIVGCLWGALSKGLVRGFCAPTA